MGSRGQTVSPRMLQLPHPQTCSSLAVSWLNTSKECVSNSRSLLGAHSESPKTCLEARSLWAWQLPAVLSFTGLAQSPAASSSSKTRGCRTGACSVPEQALSSGSQSKACHAAMEQPGRGKGRQPGGPLPHTLLGCFRRLWAPLLLPSFRGQRGLLQIAPLGPVLTTPALTHLPHRISLPLTRPWKTPSEEGGGDFRVPWFIRNRLSIHGPFPQPGTPSHSPSECSHSPAGLALTSPQPSKAPGISSPLPFLSTHTAISFPSLLWFHSGL